MIDKTLTRNDLLFAVGCALFYAVAVLVVPPYTPLIEPDSEVYIAFNAFRPALYPAFLAVGRALGLDLIAITWVQLALFCAALVFFLLALLRAGFTKTLLALLVAVLAANVLFSSFHRAILTESISFSLALVALAGWIEYLRSGRVAWLAVAGLALGLMLGFRLAGLGIVPLHALAVWVKKPQRFARASALVIALVPVALGVGAERALHYAVHGGGHPSQAPYLLTGKAALLVKPDMKFSGPHAAALGDLAHKLYDIYAPMQRTLAAAPSWPVKVQLSAAYEASAQYPVLVKEIDEAAQREGTTAAVLRSALGRQVIWQNLPGYLELTLLNQLGQWSVAAQNFPAVARGLAAYADANPGIVGLGGFGAAALHPPATRLGTVVYPAFLLAGAVTFVLALGFLAFLLRPSLSDSPAGFYLLVAAYLSAMCHAYTLLISLINVWTPRFLMAVFPHLAIIGLCLILAFLTRHRPPART
ncbi:MAG: hypothetical protein ACK4UO_06880 [Pseudolabrys sp.]